MSQNPTIIKRSSITSQIIYTAKLIYIILALVTMLGIVLLHPLPDLSIAGQRVLAVLVFAVIMWITEAVSYPVSAVAIIFFL